MKSLLISFAVIFAVSQADITPISKALDRGDAKVLASYFDERVELSILDDIDDVYTKEEATKIIADFFQQHGSKSFKQVHKGASKGADAHYLIGDLSTTTETYRLYVYMKEVNGKHTIQELRIEE